MDETLISDSGWATTRQTIRRARQYPQKVVEGTLLTGDGRGSCDERIQEWGRVPILKTGR